MNSALKYILSLFAVSSLFCFQSCADFGSGFGGYQKPAKTSNKYYTKDFKLTNTKLKVGRRYVDFDNKGLAANNTGEYSYFTFFENGFVLHNADYKKDENNKHTTALNYGDIYSQDIGSYMIKDDTIFWGTRPGYLRKELTSYYKGIITYSGISVITSTKFDKVKFFRLQ